MICFLGLLLSGHTTQFIMLYRRCMNFGPIHEASKFIGVNLFTLPSQPLPVSYFGFSRTSQNPRVSPAGVSAGDDEEFPATFNPPSPPSLWDWCTDTESGVACIIMYYPQGSWTALTTVWSYRCGSPVGLVVEWVSDLLEGSRSITVTFAKYSEVTYNL